MSNPIIYPLPKLPGRPLQQLVILVPPRPATRPRFSRRGNGVTTHNTKRYQAYSAKLHAALVAAVRSYAPDRPLSIVCEFIFEVAASHSKKKKLTLYGRPYQQHNGGDVDNLLKPIADAMQAVSWLVDDCQLAGKLGVKRYQHEGEPCATVLTILG